MNKTPSNPINLIFRIIFFFTAALSVASLALTVTASRAGNPKSALELSIVTAASLLLCFGCDKGSPRMIRFAMTALAATTLLSPYSSLHSLLGMVAGYAAYFLFEKFRTPRSSATPSDATV